MLVAAVGLASAVAVSSCAPVVATPEHGSRQPVATPSPSFTDGEQLSRLLPRLRYRGGPFLRHPRIVTITFAGEDPAVAARLRQFGSTITHTPWWRLVTADLCATAGDCIGEGHLSESVRLDETLPAGVHAVEISELLRRHARAGHLGALDPESMLLVYLPRGIGLRDAGVAHYCGEGPRAFHRTLRFDGKAVGYAVMPRCGDEATLTGSASHELLETAASPDTAYPGFAFVVDSSTLGFTAAGTGPMDPCGLITQQRDVTESGFVVRRAWSNRAASQGHDPCVPAVSDQPFVALVPDQPTVRLHRSGDSIAIALRAVTDQLVPRWEVAALDLTGSQENEHYVDVDLDRSEVAPDDTAVLRVTLRKLPPHRLCIVGIVSTLESQSYLWPVAVLTR